MPYTGNRKLHAGYNTQRHMPVAGRTNLVTSYSSGRIVDFAIQEGKGDLRGYILSLSEKWRDELGFVPVMIFDREGRGAEFFHNLKTDLIPFVTWEKHIDTKKLDGLDAESFRGEFKFNGKVYRVFEGEKTFTHKLENGRSETFSVRRIYIWNVTSRRRICALAGVPLDRMSTQDCARAILNHWGVSENTFKHLADRHPLHYQPGFAFVESEKQEIANPAHKEKKGLLRRLKSQLNNLYKQFSKSMEIFGSIRISQTI